MLVLALPLIWAGQQLYERFPSIQKLAKTIASVAFWGMLLPMVCLQPGVRRHPDTIFSLIAIVSLLSVGSFAGIIWLPKRFGKGLLTAQLIVVLLLTVLAVKFPNTANALRWGSLWADNQVGQTLAKPIEEKVFTDPDQIVFVNAAGDPTLFGAKNGDGWILADRPGFHRSGLELKPIVSQVDRDAVYSWVSAQKQNRLAQIAAAEADRRAAELVRQEREAKAREAERLAEIVKQQDLQRQALEQQRQALERKQLAEQQYRVAHVRDNAIKENPGTVKVAVMIVSTGAGSDGDSTDAITTSLKAKRCNASGDLLTELCATDGTFERLYREDAAEISRLELSRSADYLVLGLWSVEWKGPFTDGVMNAKETVEIRVISLSTQSVSERLSVTGEGLGFSKDKAKEKAREDLTKKLSETQFESLGK